MENFIATVKSLAEWIYKLIAKVLDFAGGWRKHWDFETAEF